MCAASVAPPKGRLRPRTAILDTAARDSIIARLREASYSDGTVDIATAALLDGAVSARVLDLLVPKGDYQRVAQRAEALLIASPIGHIGDTVRTVIAEDETQNNND